MNRGDAVTSIYIATAYLAGNSLAARCAADLPAHGLRLVEGGDWWAWNLPPVPLNMEQQRARTLIVRAETAIDRAGRVLVILTDQCGIGTGYEIAYARLHELPIYWMAHGPRTKEVPPVLAGYGVRVHSIAELAAVIREATNGQG